MPILIRATDRFKTLLMELKERLAESTATLCPTIKSPGSAKFSASSLRPYKAASCSKMASQIIQYGFRPTLFAASSTRASLLQPIHHFEWSLSTTATMRGFSTTASRSTSDEISPDNIRMSAEELRRKQSPDEIGHRTTLRDGITPRRERTLAAFSMAGKTCIVTGAARGLGNLMARTFLEAGASKVAFLDLKKAEAQNAAADAGKWLSESDRVEESEEVDLIGEDCDISNEESVKEAFARIHQRWGRIDVVVNSAGIVENFPAEEYETSKYRKLMQINLDGAWFVANEAARYMIKDETHGSIILIASMSASIVNYPQLQAPYNASKAGVKHLASSLAVEWAKYNIRVNSLSPGYVLTDLTRVMIEKSDYGKMLKREWEARIPLSRMAVPVSHMWS